MIKGLMNMSMITIRLDDKEIHLIKEHAKAKGITVSALVRNAVLDCIEDDIDLQLYRDAKEAHENQSEALSFDDMMKELEVEWQRILFFSCILFGRWITKNKDHDSTNKQNLIRPDDSHSYGIDKTCHESLHEWRYSNAESSRIANI